MPPAVTYLYSPDRKSEHARTLLEGCRGLLHADGYAGFSGSTSPRLSPATARLVEVACWAHCRRKLFEVQAPPVPRSPNKPWVKLLVWDGSGLTLIYKRLDEARFV